MRKIRLSDFERQAIIETFRSLFETGDHLWLFGSRADETKKGGDIDLFIESSASLEDLYKKKLEFVRTLWDKIGDQRIDVVTYRVGTPSRPIDEEARNTGVRLTMTTLEKLKTESQICDLHAHRLLTALKHVKTLFPLTPEKFETLRDEDFGFLDLMSNRFSKLQDAIGSKIFSLLLMIFDEYENRDTFIDRLNKLEKREILPTRSFWEHMREVRNEIAHEYPESSEKIISKIKNCLEASGELLSFWEELKKIIHQQTMNV